MNNNSVLIVGTGALATLFAARLAAANIAVTMLGTWQNGLDSLSADGARVIGSDGITRRFKVRATDNPAACRPARYALVLVKAWQTERAAQQLARCLTTDGLAVTLQNGLGNREALVAVLRHSQEATLRQNEMRERHDPDNAHRLNRVALGVTTTGATLLGPGLVKPGGEGVISIEEHPRVERLADMLRAADFNVNIVPDARTLAWGKLVINAAINPLTAVLRVPNGELLERPAAREVMAALARETESVARAHGVSLPFADAVRAAEEVAQKTAANHSSMYQDVKRGAPTEIDSICGAVVKAGAQKKIHAPVNWVMWQMVRALATS